MGDLGLRCSQERASKDDSYIYELSVFRSWTLSSSEAIQIKLQPPSKAVNVPFIKASVPHYPASAKIAN
jgi:hypothetical protein